MLCAIDVTVGRMDAADEPPWTGSRRVTAMAYNSEQ